MKRLGWILAAVLSALLVAALASPGSLAGIALRRAGQALGSIFSGPAASTDPEPVQLAPSTIVDGREVPWYGAR